MDIEFTVIEDGWDMHIRVNPFTGYSGVYTNQTLITLETIVRAFLDDKFSYLNDAHERNYEIIREEWPRD